MLFHEQNGKCHYCNVGMHRRSLKKAKKQKCLHTKATLDHVVVKSKGGTYGMDNLVAACFNCNTQRGNMDYELFKSIRKSPYWQERILAYKREIAFHHEILNRIKPYRSMVYI